MPSPLSVLLTPRKTLPVLAHIAENPPQPPAKAYKALGIGVNTWYAATRNLERLGLIAATRGPAGRKVKGFLITPEGEKVLAKLAEVWVQVADSRAGLDWELAERPPAAGSTRAGEVLCRLIEHAERRAEFDELKRLEGLAAELRRPGEALLAKQVAAFLKGRPPEARAAGEAAIPILRREENSRSLRKAIAVQATTLDYLGQPAKANVAYIEARRLAKRAGDHASEVDAWMGIGILHARLEHFDDAFKEFGRALKIAADAGLATKHAKVLGNLAFAEGLVDENKGLATADAALKAARRVGARIVVARTQLTRSLLLAVVGRKGEARRALHEAQDLFAEGGEEKGAALVEEWAALVKRILLLRRFPSPADWKGQALSLARTRPTRSPEGRRE